MSSVNEIRSQDNDFPLLLSEIQNPPKRLFYLGEKGFLSNTCVAIVGTRKCSDYGKKVAFEIAKRLSTQGVTIVSGLASGIDEFAHKGALEGKGSTIAVLASPVSKCYPASNNEIYRKIKNVGLILSECEEGGIVFKSNFVSRNRIISGLSVATIVIEAGLKSGALITAEFANEQGRAVYAVPANINKSNSAGSNRLIKDGAMIITNYDDILYDLGIPIMQSGEEILNLSDEERFIYSIIKNESEISENELAKKSKRTIDSIMRTITCLELEGYVSVELGKVFAIK